MWKICNMGNASDIKWGKKIKAELCLGLKNVEYLRECHPHWETFSKLIKGTLLYNCGQLLAHAVCDIVTGIVLTVEFTYIHLGFT